MISVSDMEIKNDKALFFRVFIQLTKHITPKYKMP